MLEFVHALSRFAAEMGSIFYLIVLALLLLPLFGLHGFAAQVVLIGVATPTAINAMLLCLQFNNQPDFLSRAVFYSTLLSPVTVTLVIFLARMGMV